MRQIEELYYHFIQSKGVSTDTRTLARGEIFFALSGPNFDGNDFAPDALARGAAVAVVADKTLAQSDRRYLFMPNVLTALQRLARLHRRALTSKIIAITGSNGKTTNKELCSHVLSQRYSVQCTPGNLNNHIGVPLTVLAIKKTTEIAVVEMGANHFGEIKMLCQIADPDYGFITNVGQAHLEGFGSLERIKQTKFALYHHVVHRAAGGRFFLNSDEESIAELSRPHAHLLPFSKNDLGQGLRLSIEQISPTIQVQLVDVQDRATQIRSTLYGAHNVENLKSALAIGIHFGLTVEELKTGVETYRPQMNRSQLITSGEVQIYLDAYNANPTSMHRALEFFDTLDRPSKWLIMGDMLELGALSQELHCEVLTQACRGSFERVYCVGPLFSMCSAQFVEEEVLFYDSTEDLVREFQNVEWMSQVLYIKGSRGLRLERLLAALNVAL